MENDLRVKSPWPKSTETKPAFSQYLLSRLPTQGAPQVARSQIKATHFVHFVAIVRIEVLISTVGDTNRSDVELLPSDTAELLVI